MVTVSSHVLDSVIGTHASHIRVQCFRLTSQVGRAQVFDKTADADGRIRESFQIDDDGDDVEYELVFHSAEYFAAFTLPDDGVQIMNTVVVRFQLSDKDATCHVPVMLSPHAYSVWWSGDPDKRVDS